MVNHHCESSELSLRPSPCPLPQAGEGVTLFLLCQRTPSPACGRGQGEGSKGQGKGLFLAIMIAIFFSPIVFAHGPAAKPMPHRLFTVVIDAGHGGKDSGAIGPNGIEEKNLVLNIAKHLAVLINQSKNMRALMTRQGDYFVPLRKRMRLAHKDNADLFI